MTFPTSSQKHARRSWWSLAPIMMLAASAIPLWPAVAATHEHNPCVMGDRYTTQGLDSTPGPGGVLHLVADVCQVSENDYRLWFISVTASSSAASGYSVPSTAFFNLVRGDAQHFHVDHGSAGTIVASNPPAGGSNCSVPDDVTSTFTLSFREWSATYSWLTSNQQCVTGDRVTNYHADFRGHQSQSTRGFTGHYGYVVRIPSHETMGSLETGGILTGFFRVDGGAGPLVTNQLEWRLACTQGDEYHSMTCLLSSTDPNHLLTRSQ